MPDHACARSHQRQEIDQTPPTSSPSDPLGYMVFPYGLRFKTRREATLSKCFHQELNSSLKGIFTFRSGGSQKCHLVQTRSHFLSTALISLLRPRRWALRSTTGDFSKSSRAAQPLCERSTTPPSL